MKDTTRRRLSGLSAGLLLLLLVSCNVVRALNSRAGAGSASAAATASAPGTLPLVTVVPGAAPAAVTPQQPPIPGTATPARGAVPGARPAGGINAASTAPSGLPSSAPPEASNLLAGAQPSNASSSALAAAPSASGPANPPSALSARPNGFSKIQGNAFRATGTGLPSATVRLRDARFGRIVYMQTSDSSGLFAFRPVDPGVYVVEIVGDNQAVLAASQIVNVKAGDAASVPVRLPSSSLPLGGVLGDSKTAAAIVAGAAAAAGILTTTATDPVSPTQ